MKIFNPHGPWFSVTMEALFVKDKIKQEVIALSKEDSDIFDKANAILCTTIPIDGIKRIQDHTKDYVLDVITESVFIKINKIDSLRIVSIELIHATAREIIELCAKEYDKLVTTQGPLEYDVNKISKLLH
jgi:hypothetical protein